LRLQILPAKASPLRQPATASPRRTLAKVITRRPDLLPSRVPRAPAYRLPRLRQRAREHKKVHLAPGIGSIILGFRMDHVLWRQRSTRRVCARH